MAAEDLCARKFLLLKLHKVFAILMTPLRAYNFEFGPQTKLVKWAVFNSTYPFS